VFSVSNVNWKWRGCFHLTSLFPRDRSSRLCRQDRIACDHGLADRFSVVLLGKPEQMTERKWRPARWLTFVETRFILNQSVD